ncbi:MAG TPA: hypothetical protein VKD69_15365 [Vicinamibacterales bacterium]|nr:hypothetical protein [Vicinamibacterales bacterium]
MPVVVCPLCGIRRARRSCPAVGQQICAVCCGTKRLTQIACPSDCPWLISAREHPAAAVLRQKQRDVTVMMQAMRDFDQRQAHLFLLINTFLAKYQAPELQPLVDDDVAEALSALASTYETASRGLIYEHRPASLPAERLVTALKPILAQAAEGGGSAFERDLAVVLRRAVEAVREVRALEPDNRRAFIELLPRVVIRRPDAAEAQTDAEQAPSRLIVP